MHIIVSLFIYGYIDTYYNLYVYFFLADRKLTQGIFGWRSLSATSDHVWLEAYPPRVASPVRGDFST